MDERQRIVKKTFTREQMESMSVQDLVTLVGNAGAGAKFHGSAIVKRADGSIKYDDDAVPGTYHETEAELSLNKDTS